MENKPNGLPSVIVNFEWWFHSVTVYEFWPKLLSVWNSQLIPHMLVADRGLHTIGTQGRERWLDTVDCARCRLAGIPRDLRSGRGVPKTLVIGAIRRLKNMKNGRLITGQPIGGSGYLSTGYSRVRGCVGSGAARLARRQAGGHVRPVRT